MIPPYDAGGMLPPFLGAGPHVGSSPYPTEPLEFVQRFGTNPTRITLLLGFLEYRHNLRALGIQGIQCINGSFCQDVEATEGRVPGDVDVVTFLARPSAHAGDPQWLALVTSNPTVFQPPAVKAKYWCDAYFVDVSLGPGQVISQTTYWINLFTHKKVTYEWKGALMMEIGPTGIDDQALDYLIGLKVAP
ncbi:MAG: hypothetical protein AB7P08_12840 [Burkholderiales bacterium]